MSHSLISVSSQDAATVAATVSGETTTKLKPELPSRRLASESHPSVLPKPGSIRLPSQADANNTGPASDSATAAIYSTPFGRPPVVVWKPSSTACNHHEAAETDQSDMTSRRSPSVDVKPASYHEYDEIEPQSPPGGGGYEYADPNAVGKWSLQHIARGAVKQPPVVECEYATIPAEDSDREQAAVYSSVEGRSELNLHVPGMLSLGPGLGLASLGLGLALEPCFWPWPWPWPCTLWPRR